MTETPVIPASPTETANAIETATLTAQPAATPEAQDLISTGSLSNVPSGDVIRELGLFVGGAGAGGDSCSGDYTQPEFILPIFNLEKMAVMEIVTCGWQEDEAVRISVTDPQGTVRDLGVQNARIDADKGDVIPGVAFSFRTWPEDLAGVYTFTLVGASGTIEAQTDVKAPNGARIYALSPDDVAAYTGKPATTAHLLFFGFAPGESFRLLVYHGAQQAASGAPVYSLEGEMKLRAGEDGKRLIPTDLPVAGLIADTGMLEYVFAAIGEQTGEVHQYDLSHNGFPSDVLSTLNVFCQGAPQPLLVFVDGREQTFQVVTPDGQPLWLYDDAGVGNPIGAAANGAKLTVMNSPKCASGVWWWPVDREGYHGMAYAPEMINGQYVIAVTNP